MTNETIRIDASQGEGGGQVLRTSLDKSIHDTRGHEAGDRVLESVSRALSQTVREGETAEHAVGRAAAALYAGWRSGRNRVVRA